MGLHRRLVADLDDAQESIRITVALLGLYGLATGLSTIFGDADRYSSASFAFVAAPPGGLALWSLGITTNSALLLWAAWRGHNKLAAATLGISGFWNLMMAIGFLSAVLDTDRASVYAVFVTALVAVLSIQQGWLLWMGRRARLVYIPVILAQLREVEHRIEERLDNLEGRKEE